MTAQKGRLFLVKMGDGATSEAFTTIAGLRETSLTLNGESVDISNKSSGGWRELLEGAGDSSVDVAGAGVWLSDNTTFEALEAAVLAKTIHNFEIYFGNGDKYSGAFQPITAQFDGSHNKETTFSLSLMSSGEISPTRA